MTHGRGPQAAKRGQRWQGTASALRVRSSAIAAKAHRDLDTLLALQDKYAAAVLAGGLPAAIRAKYNRLAAARRPDLASEQT
jgi:hypothetical protein